MRVSIKIRVASELQVSIKVRVARNIQVYLLSCTDDITRIYLSNALTFLEGLM